MVEKKNQDADHPCFAKCCVRRESCESEPWIHEGKEGKQSSDRHDFQLTWCKTVTVSDHWQDICWQSNNFLKNEK